MGYEKLSREQLAQAVEELEELVDREEARAREWKQAAVKIKADFENYKKRQPKRKENWQKKAQQRLAQDLLSVMDNLERAVMSANEDSALLQGVKMVADQLFETLNRRGLQKIDPVGEEFNPRYHNAVEVRQHDEHNRILDTKRPGYLHGEKVLRPADVVVGKNTQNS